MAGLDGIITSATSEYRPCIVGGKKALFHRWTERANIVPLSPMVGGHAGGVIKDTAGIVEFEDGTVGEFHVQQIRFVDNFLREFAFPETEEQVSPESEKVKRGFKEKRINCPHCVGDNNNGVVYCDAAAKEYFAYCQICGIETVEIYKTEASAIKAFSEGKTKKII